VHMQSPNPASFLTCFHSNTAAMLRNNTPMQQPPDHASPHSCSARSCTRAACNHSYSSYSSSSCSGRHTTLTLTPLQTLNLMHYLFKPCRSMSPAQVMS
jgi:hypothetical protein